MAKQGWKANVLVLGLSAALVAGSGFAVLGHVQQRGELSQALEAEADMVRQVNQLAAQREQQVEKNTFEALGVDADRLAKDASKIESFLSVAFHWDSGESYERARQQLFDDFNLAQDESFMTKFMPKSQFNKDASGQSYYYLDALGLNSSLRHGTRVDVVSVRGLLYRYAVTAEVEMSTDAKVGVDEWGNEIDTPTTRRSVFLELTVDEEGQISDISGIPASGSTRTTS